MTKPRQQRPFARLYYIDLQADYPTVWYHATALGTYARLLALADKSYPAAPELPQGVSRRDLELLTTVQNANHPDTAPGLVILGDHHRFSIRGYLEERVDREAHAKVAADARWNREQDPSTPPRNAPSIARSMPTPTPEPTPTPTPSSDERTSPPPPAPTRRRADGTSPRDAGTDPRSSGANPRATGTSPRQGREAQKRGPVRLGAILAQLGAEPAP